MTKKKPVGWRGEPGRHSKAARGIKTGRGALPGAPGITDFEAHLAFACEGCGEIEPARGMPGAFQLKVDGPKTAKLYFLRSTPEIKCEKCGWHEPVEEDEVAFILMRATKSKDLRELFAWVAGRIVESEGLVK